MKTINNYITEKLHLNKNINISYEDRINILCDEIYKILIEGKFKLKKEAIKIYTADKNGKLTGGNYKSINDTERLIIYLKGELKEKIGTLFYKKLHEQVVDELNKEKLLGVKNIELAEHSFTEGKLKIIIHI